LFFPQVTGNSTSSNLLLSNAGSVFGADLGSVPQTTYSLVTNQLTVSFVPDIWGANFRAVENLDAVTEQQLFQLEAAYLALTSNVVTAAIQEASLRGQIGATNGSLRSSVTCLISSSVSSVSVRWRKRTFSRRKPLSQRLNNCFHLLRNS
jgi:outer membrane protein TolC